MHTGSLNIYSHMKNSSPSTSLHASGPADREWISKKSFLSNMRRFRLFQETNFAWCWRRRWERTATLTRATTIPWLRMNLRGQTASSTWSSEKSTGWWTSPRSATRTKTRSSRPTDCKYRTHSLYSFHNSSHPSTPTDSHTDLRGK